LNGAIIAIPAGLATPPFASRYRETTIDIAEYRRAGMAEESFVEFINRERARLDGERESIHKEQQQLKNKLADIERELAAIGAYEAAKSGRSAARPAAVRGGRRPRRGGKREQLLALIRQNPAGLARRDILERMGLKGDKSGEMSVSNALTALTKAGQVLRRDGKYIPA
jgi:hypothetical protein